MENINNSNTGAKLLAKYNIRPCSVVVEKLAQRYINHCARKLPQKIFTTNYANHHLCKLINSAHKNLNVHQKYRKSQKEQKVNVRKLYNSTKAAKSHSLDFKKFKAVVSVSTVAHKLNLNVEKTSIKENHKEEKSLVDCNTLKSALSLPDDGYALVDTKYEELCSEAVQKKLQVKVKRISTKNSCSPDSGKGSYTSGKDKEREIKDKELHFPDGFTKKEKCSEVEPVVESQHDCVLLDSNFEYLETSEACPGSSKDSVESSEADQGSSKDDVGSLEACPGSAETIQKSKAKMEFAEKSPELAVSSPHTPSPVAVSESPSLPSSSSMFENEDEEKRRRYGYNVKL